MVPEANWNKVLLRVETALDQFCRQSLEGFHPPSATSACARTGRNLTHACGSPAPRD